MSRWTAQHHSAFGFKWVQNDQIFLYIFLYLYPNKYFIQILVFVREKQKRANETLNSYCSSMIHRLRAIQYDEMFQNKSMSQKISVQLGIFQIQLYPFITNTVGILILKKNQNMERTRLGMTLHLVRF